MLRDRYHSQIVTGMKIVLPLGALGLLSTLFLLSRSIQPHEGLPFAEEALAQRMRDQGASSAQFTGVTDSGDLVRFNAEQAVPDSERPNLVRADTVTAKINLKSGAVIDMDAAHALLDQDTDYAELIDDVVVVTSDGYVMNTERLVSRFTELHAESPGPVTGNGPPGDIRADYMLLHVPEGSNDDDAELLFTGRVKVIYDRSDKED